MSSTIEVELGIKVDHHHIKQYNKPVNIGKFCVNEVSHNEWEVTTRDGVYLDTFSRRDQAVAYAKALKSR